MVSDDFVMTQYPSRKVGAVAAGANYRPESNTEELLDLPEGLRPTLVALTPKCSNGSLRAAPTLIDSGANRARL
jgi:hypothetical protein